MGDWRVISNTHWFSFSLSNCCLGPSIPGNFCNNIGLWDLGIAPMFKHSFGLLSGFGPVTFPHSEGHCLTLTSGSGMGEVSLVSKTNFKL